MTNNKVINEVYIELIARNENTRNPFVICKCAIRDLEVEIPIIEIVTYLKHRGPISPVSYNLKMKEIFN